MRFKKTDVVVAANGTVSSGFSLEPWAIFIGARFPAMDNGDIGIAISIDGGSNYDPGLDPAAGGDVVICASGSDPGWIDFSDFVRFVPQNTEYLIRFTCASQASGAVNIPVIMRG